MFPFAGLLTHPDSCPDHDRHGETLTSYFVRAYEYCGDGHSIVPPPTDRKKTPTWYIYRPEATQVDFYPFFGRPLPVFRQILATGCSPSPSFTPELLAGNTPNRQSRPRQTRRGDLLRTYVRVPRRWTIGSPDHDRHDKNTHMYRHSVLTTVLVTVHGRMSRSAPNFEQHNRTYVNSGESCQHIQHISN